MKTNFLKTICILLASTCAISMNAQTVSYFENLTLSPDTFSDGASQPLGTYFSSGNAEFYSFYDTSFGGFWGGGFAYTNMTDSATAGFGNQYSARTGIGFYGSANYAIGKQDAIVRLTGDAAGKAVSGLYVTNSTYAYLSMKDGDAFAKQFGSPNDANGISDGTNGEDWFLLTIYNWHNGALSGDSVNFHLADFRDSNNAQDYIVKTWEWIDLTSLGNVDSLQFKLTSSDVGSFGMNTPAFFCVDNFTTTDASVGIFESSLPKNTFSIYPNPSTDFITISLENLVNEETAIQIFDVTGKLVANETFTTGKQQISIVDLKSGLYRTVVSSKNFSATGNFLKQ